MRSELKLGEKAGELTQLSLNFPRDLFEGIPKLIVIIHCDHKYKPDYEKLSINNRPILFSFKSDP